MRQKGPPGAAMENSMRKYKIAVLAATVCMLPVFLLLRVRLMEREAVAAGDITFAVQAGEGEIRLKLWHNDYDGKEYLFLPAFCDENVTCVIESGYALSKSWDGQRLGLWGKTDCLQSGEHVLRVRGSDYTVKVMRSANIPALFITTQSGSLSYIEAEKGNGEPGMYEMIMADGSVLSAGGIEKLKSRGNVTFLEDKKPYQMSLQEPADLLGTGRLENYILLANRQDRSLLRDRIVYDMAGEMGLAYSPASIHIDLYVNEEYRGSYQLSEKAEAAPGRIPVSTGGSDTETGFLTALEYTERAQEENYYFVTENGQSVIIRRPKAPSAAQFDYICRTFQETEDAIRQGRIEESCIDITSFARKYLVEEISKNLDAMYSSQYFYKDAGAKASLYAGPVWDYDKSLGNPLIEHTRPVNYQEPRGIFAATKQENASWWYDLYEQPYFRKSVIKEYRESAVPVIEWMVNERIDAYRDEIWESARMDYMRWDPFEDFKYERETDFEKAYGTEVNEIREFLRLRMEFLNDIWLEGRRYDRIQCDPGDGVMYVTLLDAIEGRTINEPRDPKREGYVFDHWIRQDTGELYDFTEIYDGVPFTLQAVYIEDK